MQAENISIETAILPREELSESSVFKTSTYDATKSYKNRRPRRMSSTVAEIQTIRDEDDISNEQFLLERQQSRYMRHEVQRRMPRRKPPRRASVGTSTNEDGVLISQDGECPIHGVSLEMIPQPQIPRTLKLHSEPEFTISQHRSRRYSLPTPRFVRNVRSDNSCSDHHCDEAFSSATSVDNKPKSDEEKNDVKKRCAASRRTASNFMAPVEEISDTKKRSVPASRRTSSSSTIPADKAATMLQASHNGNSCPVSAPFVLLNAKQPPIIATDSSTSAKHSTTSLSVLQECRRKSDTYVLSKRETGQDDKASAGWSETGHGDAIRVPHVRSLSQSAANSTLMISYQPVKSPHSQDSLSVSLTTVSTGSGYLADDSASHKYYQSKSVILNIL